MKKMHRLLAVPLFALLLTGWGLGAESAPAKETKKESAKTAQPKKKATKAKRAKNQKFVGDISAVDTKTGAVSVKGAAGEKNFITQDAAKDALERLSVGERVRVQYSDKDGKLLATSVRRVKLPQTKTKSNAPSTKAKAPTQQKQTKDAVK